MEDQLKNEVFTCMYCQKQFDITQGTFPQRSTEDGQPPMLDADYNTREKEEFVCYDCCD